MTDLARTIYHAVERHPEINENGQRRKKSAWDSWEHLYQHQGVVPCQLWNFARTSKGIGDARALPYLRDVISYGMAHANGTDIVMLTNDDVYLHRTLPDALRFHVAVFGACSCFRVDYDPGIRFPAPDQPIEAFATAGRCITGLDMFAFTKSWLEDHWSKIPDFLVGASEWDWCLAAIIRKSHGIVTTRENIKGPIHPSELPYGYVCHQWHQSVWLQPDNVNASPSQIHNRRLMTEWCAANLPDFKLVVYRGDMPNRTPENKDIITVRRSGSLGDVLASLCVADALIEQGYAVNFQSDNASHCLLQRHGRLNSIALPNGHADVNLDGCYENDPLRTRKHFAQMFMDKANEQLRGRGITLPVMTNYAPKISANGIFMDFGPHDKPWVLICPKSESWANRTIPDHIWKEAAEHIKGTCFWLGSGPAPEGIIDLKVRHVDRLVEFIKGADLLATVDTGPLHIAAAVGTPAVAVLQSSSPALHLSDQRDWIMVKPPLDCLNCQQSTCHINAAHPPCQDVDPLIISAAVNGKLQYCTTENVSAIIAVYKPDIARLNRCLECVLPQVQEVVVAGDLDTTSINGVNRDSKIIFVQKKERDTGYGRKANYGARHSTGRYLLFLNDDVFLEPHVVQQLLAHMKPDVAVVTHLLRYEDGTIQYAGKHRPPGAMGFGHTFHRARVCGHAGPVYQDSVCGASMLVRRGSFYQADGFDERFHLYSEDDDLGLKIRRNGWKIVFTPHACGTHLEHQSTNITPGVNAIMVRSNALLAKKWKTYFETGSFA